MTTTTLSVSPASAVVETVHTHTVECDNGYDPACPKCVADKLSSDVEEAEFWMACHDDPIGD